MIKALEEKYPEMLLEFQHELMNAVMTSGVKDFAELEFARGQVHGLETAKHEFNELMQKMREGAEDLRE